MFSFISLSAVQNARLKLTGEQAIVVQFNRLGCSFYCEDHVQFHIFIRSSERKAQANWRAGHCGFNRLGCSFYCEDHVQFHIFIRSSNHFIYFSSRIFLYQLLFSPVMSFSFLKCVCCLSCQQLQRVWTVWLKRCEHSEELKLHSVSKKARAHYR